MGPFNVNISFRILLLSRKHLIVGVKVNSLLKTTCEEEVKKNETLDNCCIVLFKKQPNLVILNSIFFNFNNIECLR